MARETVYIVQAYKAGRGKGLKAEQQVGCKDAEEARRKAERLAPLARRRRGLRRLGRCRAGRHDENPQILFKAGRLPFPFDQA